MEIKYLFSPLMLFNQLYFDFGKKKQPGSFCFCALRGNDVPARWDESGRSAAANGLRHDVFGRTNQEAAKCDERRKK